MNIIELLEKVLENTKKGKNSGADMFYAGSPSEAVAVRDILWGKSELYRLAPKTHIVNTSEVPEIPTEKKKKLEVSNGLTARYYELPKGAKELQDLISYKDMNAQMGEIFRAAYRYGEVAHSDQLRDIRKILYYAKAEEKRLYKMQAINIFDAFI